MSSPLSSPRVSRALYRFLLRSSNSGRNPEVFGHYGATVTSSFAASSTNKSSILKASTSRFPSTPSEVRNILHYAFSSTDDVCSTIDPFAVLRHANETAAILHPSQFPLRLPIFEYNSSAALPGERLDYNFFEPRFLKLVEMATCNNSTENGSGYFLLRVGKPQQGGAILLRIVEHKRYKDVIGVQCVAGPRIKIKEEESIDIVSSDNNQLLPLAVATQFQIFPEEVVPSEKYLSLKEKRTHILDLLYNISDLDGTVSRVGLPPINITEFSFWALRFVLDQSDVASRQRWLFRCSGTEERIQYVQDFLESVLDKKTSQTKPVQ